MVDVQGESSGGNERRFVMSRGLGRGVDLASGLGRFASEGSGRGFVVSRGVKRGLAFVTGLSWFASPVLYSMGVVALLAGLGQADDNTVRVVLFFVFGLGLPLLLTLAVVSTRRVEELLSVGQQFDRDVREAPTVRKLVSVPDELWKVGPLAGLGSVRCVSAASFGSWGVHGVLVLLDAEFPGEAQVSSVQFGLGVTEGVFDEEELTLVGPDVDLGVWDFGDDFIDLRPFGVVAPWRAFASSVEVVARALNSRVVERLNGVLNEGVVVHRREDRLLVWQSPGVDFSLYATTSGVASFANAWSVYHAEEGVAVEDDNTVAQEEGKVAGVMFDSGIASELARTSGVAGFADRWSAPAYGSSVAGQQEAVALETASVGRVVPSSRLGVIFGVVMFYFGLTAVSAGLATYGLLSSGEVMVGGGFNLVVSVTVTVVSAVAAGLFWRYLSRDADRRKVFALEVRRFANTRTWDYVMKDKELARVWSTLPLSRVANLSIGPVSRGAGRWGDAGVALAMGDYTVAGIPVRTFLSRMAWAHLAEESASVSFVREGFSERAAGLLGGSDVDVESAEFNRRWRVLSDDHRAAHAMLTPTMILFLTDVADEGLAFHVDGGRVLLWDDGRRVDVDLTRRMELLERFVGELPSFLRVSYTPYSQE